jgi:DNA-binding Lrp family transcriptional regulator
LKEMDDIDVKLLVLLVGNPRIHFHELSRKIGISKQAAYRRWLALKESGVIERMTADISVTYLDAVPVAVFGRSNAASVLETLDKLGECEFTRRAFAGCGNYIYVNGLLRDISDLGEFSEFVIRTADLQDATVGIYSPDPGLTPHYIVDGITNRKPDYKKLTPLDLRIIALLKDNVRMPVQEIAEVLGVTTKTIKRHLEDMTSEGKLELHVRTDPSDFGDMFFAVHVTLRDGADKGAVGRRLLSKYEFRDAFLLAFSNIPSLLMWIFWSGDLSEMRKILKAVDEDEDIAALMINYVYLQRFYSTWQDRLPQYLMHASELAKPLSRRPGLTKY